MKHRLTRFILTAGLSALFGSLVLSAQDQKEVANIPFAFQANDRVLPAGEYKVSETRTPGIFVLSDADAHSMFLVARLNDTGARDNPRLTFRCYGNERVLSQIWMENGSEYSLPESSAEKNLHRRLQMAALVSVRLTPR